MSVAKQNVLSTLVRFLGKDFSLHRKVVLTLCRATLRQVTALIFQFCQRFLAACPLAHGDSKCRWSA